MSSLEISAVPAATTWTAPAVAVIVPTFNERENIALLYEKVMTALGSTPFEFIVVDDNSPDGTAALAKEMAQRLPNMRCLHRLGRRGLAAAVSEGAASAAAPYIAVIDADLQHDERILPAMLARAIDGADIVVGTRYAGAGSASEGLSVMREQGSRLATQLSSLLTGKSLSDPMSGFFLMRRALFDKVAPGLSAEGFKVLLDIIVSATRAHATEGLPLTIAEVPYTFRTRHAGTSKMGPLVVIQFLGLLLSRMTRGVLPTSFLMFAMVGTSGLVVHLITLAITHDGLGFTFAYAQLAATLVAMTTNFVLNNALTYADRKLKGARFWRGLITFYLVCSIGTIANVAVAANLFAASHALMLSGIAGAMMSVVFNYSVTRILTWR